MNQQNIDLTKTTAVTCEECGSVKFRPFFFIRKLSRFVSPDGKDTVIPIDSLECAKCGHVNKEFTPNIPDIYGTYESGQKVVKEEPKTESKITLENK